MAQVWPDDAAEEVDSPVEARRRQTAPQRCSALGAAGDAAVDGRSLRRDTDRKEIRGSGSVCRPAQNQTHKRVLQSRNMNDTTDRSEVRGHHEERGVQSVRQVSSALLWCRWTHLLHSEEQHRTPDRWTVGQLSD